MKTTLNLYNIHDNGRVLDAIAHIGYPCIVTVKHGKDRSIEQNKTQFMWFNEAARTLKEDTAEGHRAYCKLHFGVPIAKEDEHFAEVYDRVIKPLSYEQKLELMAEPIDFPVTRNFSVKQMSRYMDDIYNHFTGLGVKLTMPPDRRYEDG